MVAIYDDVIKPGVNETDHILRGITGLRAMPAAFLRGALRFFLEVTEGARESGHGPGFSLHGGSGGSQCSSKVKGNTLPCIVMAPEYPN